MAFPADINAQVTVNASDSLQAAGHAARHNEVKTALQGVQAVLQAGSNGQVLIPDSGASTGLRWVDQQSNRNLLYNGAMQVAQRATSTASITSGDSYNTADRWRMTVDSLGTWTQSVESDGPTGSGLRKSLKMLCTTADASPAAGDYLIVSQLLEGQDVQRVLKGTSAAQQLTLSFWVKSNVTGTFIAEAFDVDNSRRVSASYTVSASATWEKKTLTFPADTTGAFDNDNAASLLVSFWLGSGSSWAGGSPLQTTWGTGSNTRATGQTNLAAATNNYWQVTGVQLEVGPVATSFEFKPFGQELRECQRYYEKTYPYANAPGSVTSDGFVGVGGPDSVASTYLWAVWRYRVDKRAAPTRTIYDTNGNSGKISTWQSGSQTNNVTPGNANWTGGTTSHTVLHQGNVSGWYFQATADAEL